MGLSHKILLLVFFSFLNIYSQDTQSLRSRIDTFLAGVDLSGKTNIAIEIYDLTNVQNLYSLNNKLLLHPASNMKLLTTAAALLFLKDYSFTTSVAYTGEIINGTLQGNIFIKGGCDPAFTLADLDSMILYLKAAGIERIYGSIFADISFKDGLIWGNGWMWDDDPSADAPYLSALNINDNLVKVFATSSDTLEKPEIRTEPSSSYFIIENNSLVSRGMPSDSLNITRDWLNRSNTIKVTGSMNADRSERVKVLNVFDPADYFLTLFTERLSRQLISFDYSGKVNRTPSIAKDLFAISRPLDSILNMVNKSSNNLAAEMMLYALAEKYYGRPAAAKNGLLLIDSLVVLSGLNANDYRFADGSGVSHYNLVSAELLLSVMKYLFYQHPSLYEKLYNSLAVAGADGTLRNRMKGTSAEGKIHAKTGTLTGVSCLSGFAETAGKNLLAFSILVQNHSSDDKYARYIQDEICRIMAEYK